MSNAMTKYGSLPGKGLMIHVRVNPVRVSFTWISIMALQEVDIWDRAVTVNNYNQMLLTNIN